MDSRWCCSCCRVQVLHTVLHPFCCGLAVSESGPDAALAVGPGAAHNAADV